MGYIEDDYMNEIDGWVINRFSPSKYFKSWPRLETTLRRVVLAFSDQQAVTGIALLGSGYVAMLAVALLPTGDTLWSFGDDGSYQQSQGVPALCYFRRLGSHEHQKQFDVYSPGFISMIISIFILASGYLTRAVKLSNRASNITKAWFNEKPSHSLLHLRDCALERLERPVPTSRKIQWVVGYILIETFNVWFKVLYDIYASMLWEVCVPIAILGGVMRILTSSKIIWLVSALAWGTRNLFAVRVANNIDAESSWGFGQIFTNNMLKMDPFQPLPLAVIVAFLIKNLQSFSSGNGNKGRSPLLLKTPFPLEIYKLPRELELIYITRNNPWVSFAPEHCNSLTMRKPPIREDIQHEKKR
ncbi:MAG: hypothetical protein L6R41_005322 [Letrouitia leprolyta]|nr:MAG: hypothetical protein L6R41_005322 [Letrouitia leprolyta]